MTHAQHANLVTWAGLAVGILAVLVLLGALPLPAWASPRLLGVFVVASLLLLLISPEPRRAAKGVAR